MQKLSLNVDTLTVQSFPTATRDANGRGTVLGHAAGAVFAPSYIDFTFCQTNCTCPDTR